MNKRCTSATPAFLLTIILGFASTAQAQSSASAQAQSSASAQALFDQGLADMQAHRYDTACPALRESLDKDPRPGTLFTLAECEAQAGLLATAVARYEKYLQLFESMSHQQRASQSVRPERATAAKARLEPLVPMLTVTISPSSPPGTKVRRDDLELDPASLGLPLPVDPGEHVITAQPPDGPIVKQRLTIGQGEKKSIELTIPPPKVLEPEKPKETIVSKSPATNLQHVPASRIGAYVCGGVGLAALGVGVATGAIVIGKKKFITAHCHGPSCDAEGLPEAQHAQRLGAMSTLGFVVGGLGLLSGTVLFLVSPGGKKNPAVGVRVAGGPLSSGGGIVQVETAW